MRPLSAAVLRTQPDATLAALAADGSEAAFEAIVRRHRRALLAYCRRLLLSESRSEDVVQQAFVDAWSALRAGTEVRETRAWLYRITHNRAVRARRVPEYDFDALSEALSGADAPQSDLERRLLVREALAAVAALPEQQRDAILRTALDGQSYEQVALALGISDGAVRGLVYRARASLRAALAAAAPPPLVLWAAAHARRGVPLAQWITEVLSAGGSSDSAAVALKSITVLATSAVVVSGTLGGAVDHVGRTLTSARHPDVVTHREHATPGAAGASTSASAGPGTGNDRVAASSGFEPIGLGRPGAGSMASFGRAHARGNPSPGPTDGAMGTRQHRRAPVEAGRPRGERADRAAAPASGNRLYAAVGGPSGGDHAEPVANAQPTGEAPREDGAPSAGGGEPARDTQPTGDRQPASDRMPPATGAAAAGASGSVASADAASSDPP